MNLKISWGSTIFGMALGAGILYLWQNWNTIVWGVEHRKQLGGAAQVIDGVKKIFS